MVEASLGIVGACLPSMRPIFRDFSLKSVFHRIRRFTAASQSLSRKLFGTREKADNACPKSSTCGLSQKCLDKLEANRDP